MHPKDHPDAMNFGCQSVAHDILQEFPTWSQKISRRRFIHDCKDWAKPYQKSKANMQKSKQIYAKMLRRNATQTKKMQNTMQKTSFENRKTC